ncbi:flagellar basal body rod protein FlgB [Clostridium sp. 'deep sea']|uniref:flagellar basal body rod protein FlgB n=1 Tax=Clostridium sp. 'deep sea' TaxID=2779445 RepID=UPI0018968C7B|nr:flagellar basal body rod protein FlgB [Clostridium sp. 'deep sea']QOR35341.1 flagellar basal body rod protein FlgB [Clostridium sp. 'deep sea']
MFSNMYSRLDFFQKGLDGLQKRHETIANNIANHDTPGFKAKDVNFQQVLTRHLKNNKVSDPEVKTIKKQFNMFSIYNKKGLLENIDGNNVNVDKEMVALSDNKMQYDLMVEALRSQMKLFDIVIDSTKR